MKIAENVFVAIEYRLSLESGREIDRSPEGEPLGFVTCTGRIIPGLENALMGRKKGDRALVTLEPEDAYGPVDENLIRDLPRSRFPIDAVIEPDSVFQAPGPRGPVTIIVKKIQGDTVTVDLNHPMAGKRLFFDVNIVEVREPRAEELPRSSNGCGCGSRELEGCGCDSAYQGDCGSGCNCG